MPIQTGYIVLSDVSDGNNGESVFLAYADNVVVGTGDYPCLLYTSPSPRDS